MALSINCCAGIAATTDCFEACALTTCSCFDVTTCEVYCDNTSPPAPANQAPYLDSGLYDQTISTGAPSNYTLPGCIDPDGSFC